MYLFTDVNYCDYFLLDICFIVIEKPLRFNSFMSPEIFCEKRACSILSLNKRINTAGNVLEN